MAQGSTRDAWLLSSAGRRGSLLGFFAQRSFVDDRGQAGRVVATDCSELSAAGHLADVFEIVPRVSAPEFVDRMLEICSTHSVGVIIPTIDPEIAVYAENRALFRDAGTDVWVSSPEVAALGWDKWSLYGWLREQGLPTVNTVEASAVAGADLSGPVICKPRSGSSGIGVFRRASVTEVDPAELPEDYIVQEAAPGFEVTVDFAVGRSGKVLGIVPRRRIEVRGGEVSKGVTVDYPEVIDVARRVAEALPGAYGVLNVQMFFEPRTGTINVIEINPRFGGGYPLAHRAGADLIDAMIRDGRGEDVSEVRWRPGTLLLRYDAEVIVEGFDFRTLDA